jgi:hypothetical protein
MRIVERWNSCKRNRKEEMRFVPEAPLLTLEECAEALNLTYAQVEYLHKSALQKLGAALSAWGYHREGVR